ncbi:hypothetical protein Hanom_Chr08g00703641 [Helianthus anomalus]
MAKVIAWRFERKEKRFIIKFSDRRRVKVRTIKAMMGMNENVQKDILALEVPRDNDCERTKTVIKRLEKKFPAEDAHIPKLSSWVLHEEEGTLEVTYKNGVQYSRPMEEMLKTGLLSIIEQLCDLTHSNNPKSKDVVIFKNRLQQRRDELMALYAKMKFDDEESEESDEQSDGYISDVIPPTEDY